MAAPGKSHKGEAVTVLLRLRPCEGTSTSLFEVHEDGSRVTLHPPIAAEEAKINAASPATAMKLTFGLGATPSKIPRTPVRHTPGGHDVGRTREDRRSMPSPRRPHTPGTPGAAGTPRRASAPTPWRTPARSKPGKYAFDRVFGPTATQKDVYSRVEPLADMVVAGYNSSVIAYGATGAGKTHTIMGTKKHAGVMQRLIHSVFQRIQAKSDSVFTVMLTYVELYNNQVRDLLGEVTPLDRDTGRRELPHVTLREARGRVILSGTSTLRVPISSLDDALKLVKHGNKNRSVACTNMNEHSSRSHAIVMIDVESQAAGGRGPVRRSRLNIVDLAGSERVGLSGTGDDPVLLSETQAINSSLTALADVLSALSSENKELWLVPYRNSKLTFLLRDSLGGNAKTVMITHCHSTARQYKQSKVSLMYATRAKRIRNRVRANISAADGTELQKRLAEIARLKEAVALGEASLAGALKRRDETMAENARLRSRLREVEAAHAEQARVVAAATTAGSPVPAAAAPPSTVVTGSVAPPPMPSAKHVDADGDIVMAAPAPGTPEAVKVAREEAKMATAMAAEATAAWEAGARQIAELQARLKQAEQRQDTSVTRELTSTLSRLQRLSNEKRMLEEELEASAEYEAELTKRVADVKASLTAKVEELESSMRCVINNNNVSSTQHAVALSSAEADLVLARRDAAQTRMDVLLQEEATGRLQVTLADAQATARREAARADHAEAQRDALVDAYRLLVSELEAAHEAHSRQTRALEAQSLHEAGRAARAEAEAARLRQEVATLRREVSEAKAGAAADARAAVAAEAEAEAAKEQAAHAAAERKASRAAAKAAKAAAQAKSRAAARAAREAKATARAEAKAKAKAEKEAMAAAKAEAEAVKATEAAAAAEAEAEAEGEAGGLDADADMVMSPIGLSSPEPTPGKKLKRSVRGGRARKRTRRSPAKKPRGAATAQAVPTPDLDLASSPILATGGADAGAIVDVPAAADYSFALSPVRSPASGGRRGRRAAAGEVQVPVFKDPVPDGSEVAVKAAPLTTLSLSAVANSPAAGRGGGKKKVAMLLGSASKAAPKKRVSAPADEAPAAAAGGPIRKRKLFNASQSSFTGSLPGQAPMALGIALGAQKGTARGVGGRRRKKRLGARPPMAATAGGGGNLFAAFTGGFRIPKLKRSVRA